MTEPDSPKKSDNAHAHAIAMVDMLPRVETRWNDDILDKPPSAAAAPLLFQQKLKYRFSYTIVSAILLLAVLAGYVFPLFLDSWAIAPLEENPGFGPSKDALVKAGAIVTAKLVDDRDWSRMVLPMVLGSSAAQIVLNVLFILLCCRHFEHEYGRKWLACLAVFA